MPEDWHILSSQPLCCDRAPLGAFALAMPKSKLDRHAMIHISPRLKALADALRPALDMPKSASCAALDCEMVKYALRRHRVAGLLHNASSNSDRDIPKDASELLSAAYKFNVNQTLKQMAVSKHLSQLMHQADIGHTEIKGWRLGKALYGDASLRQAKDIDLLVDPLRMNDAIALLRRNGFLSKVGRKPIDPRRAKLILNFHREVSVRHPKHGVEIELHSRMLDWQPPGWLAPQLSPNGQPTPQIDQADYVLYLILHGALTGWSRLKWLCDLAMLTRRVPPNIRLEVVDRARAIDCLPALFASLAMIATIWGEENGADWREQTKLTSKDRKVTGHIKAFAARLSQDEGPTRQERFLRSATIMRDEPVFGRHPPRSRALLKNAAIWALFKT